MITARQGYNHIIGREFQLRGYIQNQVFFCLLKVKRFLGNFDTLGHRRQKLDLFLFFINDLFKSLNNKNVL